VGIVRVSGDDLGALIEALCGRRLEPRCAHFGPFLDDRGEAIDRGLAIHFPAPHSYTGEDVLELQAHGGPVVLQLLLARCLAAAEEPWVWQTGPGSTPATAHLPSARRSRLPKLRLARPGEFTERAFLNGKLDLAQAEAVADLIDASTEAAARSAGRALEGAFSRDVERLREELVALRVLVEATLDFPEEEIDFLTRADAHGRLARIDAALADVRRRARQGVLLREGLRVVLAGQPNVGKSSLLNALAGAELAIVTAVAGTTRDKVAETIQIDGVPLHVIDTAGLRDEREAGDEAERIGMQRSWGAIETADAVVFLHDLTRQGEPAYEAAERDIAARLPAGVACLHAYNKADAASALCVPAGALTLSARTGAGLEALRARLLELAGWQSGSEGVFIARARHLEALQRTAEAVDAARRLAAQGDGALELLAEELRRAHEALGQITGATTPDDLLGEIFGRFCIGK
jgi:tRNA modification GTPase